jgi:hypothetical protein
MSSKLGPFKASQISLLIPILLCLYPLARADYHYASHSGSNEYPYTSWETAADSITAAMNAASPYDTIFIAGGEYNEILRAGTEDSCLTFIGTGNDSTHCWTDSTVNLWAVGNGTIVKNIWFQHFAGRPCVSANTFNSSIIAVNCKFMNGVGILATGDSSIIENCEFFDCEEAANLYAFNGKFVFKNNFFHFAVDNRGTQVFGGHWSRANIENNIFYIIGNGHLSVFDEYNGIEDSSWFRNNYIDNFLEGHTIMVSKKAIIENNTVRKVYYNNNQWDHGFWVNYGIGDSGTVVFKNNSISECGTGIYAPHDSLNISYNAFWGNIRADMQIIGWDRVDSIGNFNAYPMFANPDSFDVHLQEFSPLIDTGDPNILDVDGTRSDIGIFGGPVGVSYEYQDLPPRKPDSLAYHLWPDTIIVSWNMNLEADFNRYIVWRDTVPDFIPWAGNILIEPDTNIIYDTNWDNNHNYYYRIAAYDNQLNLSQISNELVVLVARIEGDNVGVETPHFTAIDFNYPNPFNSSTTIVYTVANIGPIPAQINIDIYDIQGRKVRSLLNDREEVGKHTVTWDGRSDNNNELASGVYFARIMQWNVDYLGCTKRLVLAK